MFLVYTKNKKLIEDVLLGLGIPFENPIPSMGNIFLLKVDTHGLMNLLIDLPAEAMKSMKIHEFEEWMNLNIENILLAIPDFATAKEFMENYIFSNLSQILSTNQLHFHAIIDAKTKKIYGFESLCRLSLPIIKLLRISERVALLTENYCREEAIIEFGRRYPNTSYHLFLNFSPKLLKEPVDSVGELLAFIQTKEINPSRIVVEICEYEEIDIKAIKFIRDVLKREGIKVALDDVGTANSCLHQLVEIYPDIAKVDMSLIRDIHKYPIKQAVLTGLVSACKSADIKVLVEGIEKKEELDCIVRLDVDLLQGFLFAKPEPHPNIREIEDLASRLL